MSGEIKERPILFSGPLVCAILEGCKTQTRRPVKVTTANRWLLDPEAGWDDSYILEPGNNAVQYSPFGQPGDRLWVRETHRFTDGGEAFPLQTVRYRATDEGSNRPWRPSIHMPRWASRINLEVTGVRVERIQDASNGDLVHEGWPDADDVALAYASVCKTMHGNIDDAVVEWFAEAWDAIYEKQGLGWDANPWVWAIDFKVLPA